MINNKHVSNSFEQIPNQIELGITCLVLSNRKFYKSPVLLPVTEISRAWLKNSLIDNTGALSLRAWKMA